MRKLLIIILIILLLVAGYFMMFRGLEVFGTNILSIYQIQDKNADLEDKLQKVSILTSVDQPEAISNLNESAKQLTIAKDEYNDKVLYSTNEDILTASQSRPYTTEYLWITLGNHAKKNGVNLKYELRQDSSGVAGQYNINFTLTGSYVAILEFVEALENDSSLNFKIESFKLVPNSGNIEILQSTFVVKSVNVKVDGAQSTTQTNSTQSTNVHANSAQTTN